LSRFAGTSLGQAASALLLAGAVALFAPLDVFAAEEVNTVGDKLCSRCHREQADAVDHSMHANTELFGLAGASCESCHGPGKTHAKSKEPEDILNPAKLDGEEASTACMGCHENTRHLQQWLGSTHESLDVGCLNCHSVHANNTAMLKSQTETETCVACHQKVRSDIQKRSVHPLRDMTRADGVGEMECSSCHNPHGTVGERLVDANTVNDKCYECHQEKKAPVLWGLRQ
jgi:DmsE family decaheme c-type cytochrome